MILSTREQALRNDLIEIEAAYQAQSEELARYVAANPKMEYSQAVLFTRGSLGHSLFYTACLMQQFGTFSSAELDRVEKNLQAARVDLEKAKTSFATITAQSDATTPGTTQTEQITMTIEPNSKAQQWFLDHHKEVPKAKYYAVAPDGLIGHGDDLETVKTTAVTAGWSLEDKSLLFVCICNDGSCS